MAEQIPYGVVVSLISKLASLAFREVGCIYGVSAELEKLKRTLECIQAELCDAEERQEEEYAVKIWISRLKEVLHDADDLFDDVVIHDLRCKVDGHSKVSEFFSSSNPVIFRHKVARKVEKIRQQLEDVSKDMSLLNLNQRTVISEQNKSDWRETSSFVLQSEIFGREEDKKEVIQMLQQTYSNQYVSLIAIVGMGGLGKTALAQLVCNDAQVQRLFQKKMWVCISEDFEVKSVLQKMLESLIGGIVGDLRLDQLQRKLRAELNRQRYMLVLDDVWNEDQLMWNDLRTYLMCGGKGSKILVTTRSKIVAQTMGINFPYVLKGLTEEQSWTLLKNLTFGGDTRRMSSNLVPIGQRIAKKCKGVPLAIRTMGGLLQSKKEESEWLNILNGDLWKLCDAKKSIMPVLKLSYQNLPLGLKQCFAYCCLYPKDWIIKKDELIQLWMAQGYLESSVEAKSMEDVGSEYIKILLMRSFFQEASMNEYDDIESFKMHDLMHDLAKSIAGNDCYLDSEEKGIVGRPMHISFVSSSRFFFSSFLDASKLRTIIGISNKFGFVTNPTIIEKLKYLRVLDLSRSSITILPKSIDKFKHLKYLDLSYCIKLIGLPDSIGNLVSLQTLKLCWCTKLENCAEVITKLVSLKHLGIDGCKAFEAMMPVGLGKLTSLQYLSNFVVGDDKKRKSGKLNELKNLYYIRGNFTICNLGLVKDVETESQEANLKAKNYIQHLQLNWGTQSYEGIPKRIEHKNSDSLQLLDNLSPHHNLRVLWVSGYPGVRFSSWLPSLTNIVHICLNNFSKCQYLPPLERLPWLKTLEIRYMAELKYMHYEEISDVFFPSLETLNLKMCENLRGWQRHADDNKANDLSLPPFPHLSSLDIGNCPNLTRMPTFPYLVKMLRLQDCSMKPLIETCMVHLESSSCSPLSALKHLRIVGVIEIEAMPEKWMQNLKSLQHFSLGELSIASPMLRHLQHLPAQLQQLDIWQVDDYKLDLWKEEDGDVSTQCQAPLHCLCSLQTISISYCDNLKALSEQICSLQSLRHIDIKNCPKLELLPEGMSCLTNLQTLSITGCPLLYDRCQIEARQDWAKIAHLPVINISKY